MIGKLRLVVSHVIAVVAAVATDLGLDWFGYAQPPTVLPSLLPCPT
jgi:hypothetical protein